MDYQSQFEAALFESHPDVQTSGTVTRKQIADVMEKLGSTKWPNWILKNQVSRGVYAVQGNVVRMPEKEDEPVSYAAAVEVRPLIP